MLSNVFFYIDNFIIYSTAFPANECTFVELTVQAHWITSSVLILSNMPSP